MPDVHLALKTALPHAPEAEQALLGALLLDAESLSRLEGQLQETDFFEELHRRIFRCVRKLTAEGRAVDAITLHNELKGDALYQEAGGEAYLASLTDRVGAQAHLLDYARIVRDKSILRELLRTAYMIQEECLKEESRSAGFKTSGVAELLDRAENAIYRVAHERATSGFTSVQKLILPLMEDLDKARHQRLMITGLPTGFSELDKLTMGLQDNELIILAGRPGQGKTALALNIVCHIGFRLQKPVAMFSLEMDQKSLMLRMLSAEAGVNGQKLRRGWVETREGSGVGWQHLTRTATRFLDADIYIDDTRILTTLEVRSRARRLASELAAQNKKLSLIVIDYLQLLRFHEQRVENRQQEVAEISRSLKALAKDLGLPVLALSQLSRRPEEKGREGRPQLSDLRESGALEQDADVVLFVYREALSRAGATPEERRKSELLIGKNRNGPTGKIDMVFLEEYTRFEQETIGAPLAAEETEAEFDA